jgi:hypothetical protein
VVATAIVASALVSLAVCTLGVEMLARANAEAPPSTGPQPA